MGKKKQVVYDVDKGGLTPSNLTPPSSGGGGRLPGGLPGFGGLGGGPGVGPTNPTDLGNSPLSGLTPQIPTFGNDNGPDYGPLQPVAPEAPVAALPPPPTPEDPAVAAAQDDAAKRQRRARSRSSTILNTGDGVNEGVSLARRTLLGA